MVVIVVQRSHHVRLRIRMAQYMSGSLRVRERTKKKKKRGEGLRGKYLTNKQKIEMLMPLLGEKHGCICH